MNKYAVTLIKKAEGLSLTPYRCAAGCWTVGWGHRLSPWESMRTLTLFEAEELLKKDLELCRRILLKLVTVPLDFHQEAALLSFIFNVGSGSFQRSTLRMKVNREDHEDVPAEFYRWVWAKGRKLPGLMARRSWEAACYGQEKV